MGTIDTIKAYFDGCNTGDAALIASALDRDVVHYFLASPQPIKGADAVARYWHKYWMTLDPRWRVDKILVSGDEAVSEWSVDFCPRGGTQRQKVRGTEWYTMRGDKILEIRAYFHSEPGKDFELAGFPYAARGYMK